MHPSPNGAIAARLCRHLGESDPKPTAVFSPVRPYLPHAFAFEPPGAAFAGSGRTGDDPRKGKAFEHHAWRKELVAANSSILKRSSLTLLTPHSRGPTICIHAKNMYTAKIMSCSDPRDG